MYRAAAASAGRGMNPAKILIMLFLLIFALDLPAQKDGQFEFVCRPYLQNLTSTTASVLWITDRYCTSWLEYGETEEMGTRAVHSGDGMVDAQKGVQKISLAGLKPGRKYFYRAASREILVHEAYKVVYGDTVYSGICSFSTPPADLQEFSFLAFNDLHNQAGYVEKALSREKGIGFVFFNGDIIADPASEEQAVSSFLKPVAQYLGGSIPFYFTRGNHETRNAAARALRKYFDSPGGGYYFEFLYGNTYFIVLDTGEDKEDGNEGYFGLADYDQYRSQQAGWLKSVIGSSDFKSSANRIVCSHIPVAKSKGDGWHGTLDCRLKFEPLLAEGGIDMLLCGHTHQPEIIRPGKDISSYPIVVGGSPTYEKKAAYVRVDVSGKKVKAVLKNADGTVIEEILVEK